MKVICINNHMDQIPLTMGKVYDIKQRFYRYDFSNMKSLFDIEGKEHFSIKNNKGKESWYTREEVVPLEEWREIKLNDLLK